MSSNQRPLSKITKRVDEYVVWLGRSIVARGTSIVQLVNKYPYAEMHGAAFEDWQRATGMTPHPHVRGVMTRDYGQQANGETT